MKMFLPTEAQWEYASRSGLDGAYASLPPDLNIKLLEDLREDKLEWCQDLYGSELKGGNDPRGSNCSKSRVARSGNLSTVRLSIDPRDRGTNLGFRIARASIEKECEIEIWPGVSMVFSKIGLRTISGNFIIIEDTSEWFWMGKFQVTQSQWEAIMGNNPSHFKGLDLPVETIDWFSTQEFLKIINDHVGVDDGMMFLLPTEAQWKYACFSQPISNKVSTNPKDKFEDYSWYEENSNNQTHTVGTKKANYYGLHDMYGNVWEWCNGVHNETKKVMLGGSWKSALLGCIEQLLFDPAAAAESVGFRVVRCKPNVTIEGSHESSKPFP